MNRRNFIKGSFSSIILLTTAGCLTPKFNEYIETPNTYKETITSYLITADGSKFVVLGNEYHYVFDVDKNLKKVLTGSFKPVVEARFTTFYVTRDNIINGYYTLSLYEGATDGQRKDAIDAGFTGDSQDLSLSGYLTGIRYSAEGFPPIAQTYKFNYPYTVKITEELSTAKKAGKILLTPIVVLADGVLILAGIALLVFIGGCGGCQ